MSEMIEYSVYMLDAIADFLAAEPMIYLFGFICLAIVGKFFIGFLSLGHGRRDKF